MVLCTMVHELTHIWQFTSLDFARMEAEHDQLLIEGQAVWAGVACLRKRQLAPAYIQQQTQRNDVYGEGYRFILEQLDRQPQYRTPFDWLSALYPQPA